MRQFFFPIFDYFSIPTIHRELFLVSCQHKREWEVWINFFLLFCFELEVFFCEFSWNQYQMSGHGQCPHSKLSFRLLHIIFVKEDNHFSKRSRVLNTLTAYASCHRALLFSIFHIYLSSRVNERFKSRCEGQEIFLIQSHRHFTDKNCFLIYKFLMI